MKRSVRSLSCSKGFVYCAVLAAVCTCAPEEARADMPKNGLSPAVLAAHQGLFDMPKNGLSPEALGVSQGYFDMPKNGLPIEVLFAGSRLPDMPKNGTAPKSIPDGQSVMESLARGALQKGAEELMKYIVSCALDPSDQVTVRVAENGSTITWPGEIGLCKQRPFGDWASGAPSKACLDMVYACLLARTNPVHLSVPVSLRGPNDALSPRSEVPLETQYREHGGTPIASFGTCVDGFAGVGAGAARNCGWSRRYAGRCLANQEVTLALRSGTKTPAETESRSEVMVRVCDGIYGCDDPAGANPTPGGRRRYSRMNATVRRGPNASVTFTCPDNGPPIQDGSPSQPARYGYFGVMLASPDPKEPVPAGIDVRSATGDATYPASEYEVFTVREGAFYGSFPGAPGSRAGEQYACYDEGWDNHMAAVTGRHCAGEGASCFANAPKPCLTKAEHRSAPGMCQGQTAPEQGGYYLSCAGTSGPSRFGFPITVYVNYSGK